VLSQDRGRKKVAAVISLNRLGEGKESPRLRGGKEGQEEDTLNESRQT